MIIVQVDQGWPCVILRHDYWIRNCRKLDEDRYIERIAILLALKCYAPLGYFFSSWFIQVVLNMQFVLLLICLVPGSIFLEHVLRHYLFTLAQLTSTFMGQWSSLPPRFYFLLQLSFEMALFLSVQPVAFLQRTLSWKTLLSWIPSIPRMEGRSPSVEMQL